MEQILNQIGLNWEVNKIPMAGKTTEGKYIDSDFFGILRSDNQSILSTCKKTYEPVQNSETVGFLQEIAKGANLKIVKGGAIDGGKKIFVQMEDLDGNITIGNDTVSRYVFAINSHDGTTSLAFGASNKVWSCQNQFFKFYKEAQMKFRHTKTYRNRVDSALMELELKRIEEIEMYENFQKWAEIKVSDKQIKNLINEISGVDLLLPEIQLTEGFSTRSINKAREIEETIHSEINQKGKTVWGLFNGVTYWTNHKDSFADRENAEVQKLMLGTGARINKRAYEFLTELV